MAQPAYIDGDVKFISLRLLLDAPSFHNREGEDLMLIHALMVTSRFDLVDVAGAGLHVSALSGGL